MENKKINFFVSNQTYAKLQEEKQRTGAPISEILRRAIEQYLGEEPSSPKAQKTKKNK